MSNLTLIRQLVGRVAHFPLASETSPGRNEDNEPEEPMSKYLSISDDGDEQSGTDGDSASLSNSDTEEGADVAQIGE